MGLRFALLASGSIGCRHGIFYDEVSKRIFTNSHGSSDIIALNAASGNVVGTVKLAGLAIDNKHDRLFVTCCIKIMVVMDALLPIGMGVDWA